MQKLLVILGLFFSLAVDSPTQAKEQGSFRHWSISGRPGTGHFQSFSKDSRKALIVNYLPFELNIFNTSEDPNNQVPIHIPIEDPNAPHRFEFTPEGNAVLVLEGEHLTRWNLNPLRAETLIDGIDATDWIPSPDRTSALFRLRASRDYSLWRLQPRVEFLRTFHDLEWAKYSDDGKKLAVQLNRPHAGSPLSADTEDKSIRIVQVWSTDSLGTSPLFRTVETGSLLGFSPDARYLSFYKERAEYKWHGDVVFIHYRAIYDLEQPFGEPQEDQSFCTQTPDTKYCYSPDKENFLTEQKDTVVQLGFPSGKTTLIKDGRVLDYSPQGELFLVRHGQDIWLYSFSLYGDTVETKKKRVHKVKGFSGSFSRDGSHFVIGTRSKYKVYRTSDCHHPEYKIERPNKMKSAEDAERFDQSYPIAFSEDGRKLVLRESSRKAHLWELDNSSKKLPGLYPL